MNMELVSEKVLLSSIAASFALSTPLSVQTPINKIIIDSVITDTNESSRYIHEGFKILSFRQKLLNYDLATIEENNQNQNSAHSTIRPFQKLKNIPVGGSNGEKILSALFINKNFAEIEVEDHVLIQIKEGKLFSLGDKGTAVKEIQKFLTDTGYYHFEKDGVFGQNMKKAVLNYQKDNGLNNDGIIGQQTYEHLAGITVNVKIEKNDPNKVVLLQNGNSEQSVKNLQQLLNKKGYYPNQIDGVLGPVTEAAVRTYQIENKLPADGIAGAVTISHLKNTPSKPLTSRSTYPPVVTEKKAANITTNELINYGKSLIGAPYIWGGTTPSGFDCSGFLMYVFKRNGVSIPRTVIDIWNSSTSVQNPEPGDIVFFETYKKGPSHAGIYIGNQNFLNAASSTGVTISSLDNSYWGSRYLGAKRVN